MATQRNDVLERAVIEQVPLPQLEGPTAMDVDRLPNEPQGGALDLTAQHLDFSSLSRQLRNVDLAPAARDEFEGTLRSQVEEVAAQLTSTAPNLKVCIDVHDTLALVLSFACLCTCAATQAFEQFKAVEAREQELKAELDSVQQETSAATVAFDEVRARRHELFTRAFEAISKNIDVIYKQLTSRCGMQAHTCTYVLCTLVTLLYGVLAFPHFW